MQDITNIYQSREEIRIEKIKDILLAVAIGVSLAATLFYGLSN